MPGDFQNQEDRKPEYSVQTERRLDGKFVVLCLLSVAFFGAMAFLTIKARDIHENALPHVKQQRLTVIPKELLQDNNRIFVVTTREKNGEERTFAEARVLVTGEETESGYRVVSGIDLWDNIIVWSDRELEDSAEVVVEN